MAEATDQEPVAGMGQQPAAARAHALLEALSRQPWKFGFLPLLRRLGALHPALPRIGHAQRPQQEPVRLGQRASLAFAPREIAEAVLPARATAAPYASAHPRRGNNPALPAVRVFGLGLLGPNGPLPLHYTEIVRERWENLGDPTLADFLDLFHHRYLSLVYRAWAEGQSAAGLDRPDDEHFSRYVAWLTGHELGEIQHGPLPVHARLSAAPHLAGGTRHPAGLAATLAHFFKVHVELQEFVMHWIDIEKPDCSRLGQANEAALLGQGAIAGEKVPDRQNKFRLVIGPLSLQQYLRFTPGGADLPVLIEWVRGFVGFEFAWEVELRVLRDSAPPARLEEGERLGWTTWLGLAGMPAPSTGAAGPDHDASPPRGRPRVASRAGPEKDHAVGMIFEPERYLPD